MLGLDNAGKTTTLYKIKLGEVVQTTPTIGFNVESVQRKNLKLSVWDVGGQDQIRGLWRHYFLNTRAVIFVVDSNDTNRLPQAATADEVVAQLDLANINEHPWHVQPACATEGTGLDEGFDWMANRIAE